jgi:DNA-binding transcriptional ArsR family regulator
MDLDQIIKAAKALSDPNRVRALMALRKGELCVCQIIALLKLAPSTISKHMLILKQAGFVDSRKDSRWVYYRLADKSATTKKLINIGKLAMATLEHDKQICKDDNHIANITSEELALICKRQRRYLCNK